MGIRAFYQHQTRAIDLIRNKRHAIVATPTASGKTLIYNLPVLERFQNDNNSKSLYIFPDCVVIITNHSDYDYAAILREAELIVDTRNAIGDIGQGDPKVHKL